MAARTITAEETALTQTLVRNARRAMDAIAAWDQAAADRMCRAVGWAAGNEETAGMLARMSVEESGMGSPEPGRRAKVLGILRDALRQKSMGVIEEIPEKGIVKYAKPAGVIASLIPVTSPYITPIGIAIYALKCKDAVIFSPHPSSRRTTNETVRLMRDAPEGDRRTRGPAAVRRAAEHSARAGAHELVRPDDRHRRAADGSRRLQLREAGLRRWRRKRDNGDRRDRRHCRGGSQYPHQQDERPRIRVLCRRKPDRGGIHLRRDAGAVAG